MSDEPEPPRGPPASDETAATDHVTSLVSRLDPVEAAVRERHLAAALDAFDAAGVGDDDAPGAVEDRSGAEAPVLLLRRRNRALQPRWIGVAAAVVIAVVAGVGLSLRSTGTGSVDEVGEPAVSSTATGATPVPQGDAGGTPPSASPGGADPGDLAVATDQQVEASRAPAPRVEPPAALGVVGPFPDDAAARAAVESVLGAGGEAVGAPTLPPAERTTAACPPPTTDLPPSMVVQVVVADRGSTLYASRDPSTGAVQIVVMDDGSCIQRSI